MNLKHPTRPIFMALHSHDKIVIIEACKLTETLNMVACALGISPVALAQLCQQINPDVSAVEAIQLVHEELQPVASNFTAFNDQWNAIGQQLLKESRFLRQAALRHDDALADTLRQFSAKLDAARARATDKRKALIDVRVEAKEAERLSPEPTDTAHAEQTTALFAERKICSDFGQMLDTSLLTPTMHERAKEMEAQKDWKVRPQAVTA